MVQFWRECRTQAGGPESDSHRTDRAGTLLSRVSWEPASRGETPFGCTSFHRHDSLSIPASARGVEQEARRASRFRAAHAAISAECFLDHAGVSRLVHGARCDARTNGFYPV